MLSNTMQEAINKQINAEFYSAYLYLAMAAYFESVNLSGFARWMRAKTEEELLHGMKFYDHMQERGGRVLLSPVMAPPVEWESPLAVFEATCEHEEHVTDLINDMVNLAIEEKDHATNNFLQWFVCEQVEEEATASDVVKKIRLIGNAPGGLFMLDRELASQCSPSGAATESGNKVC